MPKLEPALLHHLFESQYPHEEIRRIPGARQNDVTLIKGDAAIFYPSSDVPVHEKTPLGSGKPGNYITLEDTLRIASNTAQYDNKTLYIPITEERNRKHFVLLQISPDRQSATLYDSKNPPNCFLRLFCCQCTYPTESIVAQVAEVFPRIHGNEFEKIHIGSQSVTDDHSCGYQVVAMLTFLTDGKQLETGAIRSKVLDLKKVSIEFAEEDHTEADIISLASTFD